MNNHLPSAFAEATKATAIRKTFACIVVPVTESLKVGYHFASCIPTLCRPVGSDQVPLKGRGVGEV